MYWQFTSQQMKLIFSTLHCHQYTLDGASGAWHNTRPEWHEVCISAMSSDFLLSWMNCWVLEQTQPLSWKWTLVYKDLNPT